MKQLKCGRRREQLVILSCASHTVLVLLPCRSDMDLDKAPAAKKPCGGDDASNGYDDVDFSVASLVKGDVVKVSECMAGLRLKSD